MAFENIQLSSTNFSYGPVAGRVYSIDYLSNSLVVKTYPGGTLVDLAPATAAINNEILSLEYDGYYFWSLSKLGLTGTLGVQLQKWFYDGNFLIKLFGVGNEIPLVHGGGYHYNSESFSLGRYTTTLGSTVAAGSMSATFADTTFVQAGDIVSLGPSNFLAGERESIRVSFVLGNTVTFTTPLVYSYLVGDLAVYYRDIWIFNNSNGTNQQGGSLLQVKSTTGNVVGARSGQEFRGVTASSTKSNGNLVFARGTQLLEYKPFGSNSGYQTSMILQNVKPNKQDIVKVFDIILDSTFIIKLQKDLVYFDQVAGIYKVEEWASYNAHQEFYANRVFSITHTRDRSLLFKQGTTATFTAKVRDQYDLPVVGRSVTVSENDPTGFIAPGFSTFVTNSQGEGISKYTTGVGLDHGVPEITIKEDITNINSKTYYVQTPSAGNITYIQQQDKEVSNNIPVEQMLFKGSSPVVQIKNISSVRQVEQGEKMQSRLRMEQRLGESNLYIQQNQAIISRKQLEQLQPLEEPTNVQQYQFLIFAIPEPYSIKNPVDTNILVRIVGFGTLSLIPGTLVFKVNGINVSSQVSVTPFAGGLELFYNPPINFEYFSTVKVEILILDSDVPPNLISTTYTFETVADYKNPLVTEVFPADYSVNNSSTTEVYALLRDNETGIDTSSIELYVNGVKTPATVTEYFPGRFKVSYQTTEPYAYESTISAAVRVRDLAGNRLIWPWNFAVGDSSGIFYINEHPEDCSPLVPIDSSICIEAFGKEDGIKIETTVFEVNGKDVTFALVPKVYRKD